MKKMCTLLIILSMLSCTAYAEENQIEINGTLIKETAVKNNNVTLLPMRAVFEKLNAEVTWNDELKIAEAIRNGEYIRFYIADGIIETGIISSDSQYVPITSEQTEFTLTNGSIYMPYSALAVLTRCSIVDDNIIKIDIPQKAESQIFYASWSDGGRMYKIDSNGQNRQKLSDHDCYNLRYVDGYIYYSIRGEDENKPYRIKPDGTGEEKLIDKAIYEMERCYSADEIGGYIAEDGFIYYIPSNGKNDSGFQISTECLYAFNPETGEDKLVAEEVYSYEIYENNLYIARIEDDSLPYGERTMSIYRYVNGEFEKMPEINPTIGVLTVEMNDDRNELVIMTYPAGGAKFKLDSDKWIEVMEEDRKTINADEEDIVEVGSLSDEEYSVFYDNTAEELFSIKSSTDEKTVLISEFNPQKYYREGNYIHMYGMYFDDYENFWWDLDPEKCLYISINFDDAEDKKELHYDIENYDNMIYNDDNSKLIYKTTYEEIYSINLDGQKKERLFPPTKFVNEYSGDIRYSPLKSFFYDSEDTAQKYTLWKYYDNVNAYQINNEYTQYHIEVPIE